MTCPLRAHLGFRGAKAAIRPRPRPRDRVVAVAALLALSLMGWACGNGRIGEWEDASVGPETATDGGSAGSGGAPEGQAGSR